MKYQFIFHWGLCRNSVFSSMWAWAANPVSAVVQTCLVVHAPMKNCSVRARSPNTTRKKDYYKVCFCHHPSGSSPFSEAIYNTPSRSECKLPLSAAKFKNTRSFHGGSSCPYANVHFVPTLSFILPLPFHMMDPFPIPLDYIFSWPHRVPAVQHDCAANGWKLQIPVHRRERGWQIWQAFALQRGMFNLGLETMVVCILSVFISSLSFLTADCIPC